MISQTSVRYKLTNRRSNFIILVGEVGIGKKTLLREVFNDAYWVENNSVDSIREMNREAHKRSNTVFIIPDCDSMSLNAKNSLLKTVEECKNGNVFIMTVADEYNVLETLISRAQVVYMETCSPQQLKEYYRMLYPETWDSREEKIIGEICSTFGEVNTLALRMEPIEFYSFVEKVVDFIADAPVSNALKIGNSIALKNEVDKYDLKLFWKSFVNVCLAKEDRANYITWVKITSDALRKLNRVTGINKQALFTMWVLDIRGASFE